MFCMEIGDDIDWVDFFPLFYAIVDFYYSWLYS